MELCVSILDQLPDVPILTSSSSPRVFSEDETKTAAQILFAERAPWVKVSVKGEGRPRHSLRGWEGRPKAVWARMLPGCSPGASPRTAGDEHTRASSLACAGTRGSGNSRINALIAESRKMSARVSSLRAVSALRLGTQRPLSPHRVDLPTALC